MSFDISTAKQPKSQQKEKLNNLVILLWMLIPLLMCWFVINSYNNLYLKAIYSV